MTRQKSSQESLADATRSRLSFSGHGKAKGASGYRSPGDGGEDSDFLSGNGQTISVDPRPGGFSDFVIGVAWDNIILREKGFLGRLLGRARKVGVDLDLGCLYELKNGKRGAIQAFGGCYGDLSGPPYIHLSGDERTGDAVGDDEKITVNGHKWDEIKRILVYLYIYEGAACWSDVRPQIQITILDEKPIVVTPDVHQDDLCLCAIAGLENVRGGIQTKSYIEYFPGHPEMDRAFGFGISWGDGRKP